MEDTKCRLFNRAPVAARWRHCTVLCTLAARSRLYGYTQCTARRPGLELAKVHATKMQ